MKEQTTSGVHPLVEYAVAYLERGGNRSKLIKLLIVDRNRAREIAQQAERLTQQIQSSAVTQTIFGEVDPLIEFAVQYLLCGLLRGGDLSDLEKLLIDNDVELIRAREIAQQAGRVVQQIQWIADTRPIPGVDPLLEYAEQYLLRGGDLSDLEKRLIVDPTRVMEIVQQAEQQLRARPKDQVATPVSDPPRQWARWIGIATCVLLVLLLAWPAMFGPSGGAFSPQATTPPTPQVWEGVATPMNAMPTATATRRSLGVLPPTLTPLPTYNP